MKPVLLLLLLALSGPLTAQQQSNCAVPFNLRQAYERDVSDLAMKRMSATGHPDTAELIIPALQVDSIWAAMAAVFALGNSLEADSVFSRYCIHTGDSWHQWSVGQVALELDDNFTWTSSWTGMGQPLTGYPELDSFCKRYDYTFLQSFNFGAGHYVLLRTSNPLVNDAAVADSLTTFDGVIKATRPTWMGDGSYLSYSYDTAAHLGFHLGWNDCPSGCNARKSWYYTVTSGCMVMLNSVVLPDPGQIAPPHPLDCGLQPQTTRLPETPNTASLQLFPNPASNALFVEGLQASQSWRYTIVDALGRRVAGGMLASPGRVDVSALPTGSYLLHLSDARTQFVARPFVKQ